MTVTNDRTNKALGFLRTAYKDYIAARVLLNRGYTLQGVALASTAIEKYFKAAICIMTGRLLHIHLDKFDRIKKVVEDLGYGVLIEKMDPLFLQILCKAYALRYYDDITAPVTIGFFKNQFIGELDGAVALFEKLLILEKKDGGGVVLSPLQMDLKAGNPDLLENNWVAQKIRKEEFMSTNCEGFAIHIHPNNVFEEIIVSSTKSNIQYDGYMYAINVNPPAAALSH